MKSLLLYLLLVGLPVAGVLGILHAGRGLQAPPAIGGAWRTDASGQGPAAEIVLAQSGEHVEVAVAGGPRLRGRVRGDSVVAYARTEPSPSLADCDPRRALAFRARVDRSAAPHRMTGMVEFDERCLPVAFSAVRVPTRRRGGGH
jgi:hypothetical protein